MQLVEAWTLALTYRLVCNDSGSDVRKLSCSTFEPVVDVSLNGPKLQGPRAEGAMAEPYLVQKVLVT